MISFSDKAAHLHNGLEIEAHAIPESELSAARSCQQTATFGRPFNDVDRMLELIRRRMQMPRRYRIDRALHLGCRRQHLRPCIRVASFETEPLLTTYIDYVARTWPLHLHSYSALVTRPSISHPLHHRGAVISHGPFGKFSPILCIHFVSSQYRNLVSSLCYSTDSCQRRVDSLLHHNHLLLHHTRLGSLDP